MDKTRMMGQATEDCRWYEVDNEAVDLTLLRLASATIICGSYALMMRGPSTGSEETWQLPAGETNGDETAMDTAKTALFSALGRMPMLLKDGQDTIDDPVPLGPYLNFTTRMRHYSRTGSTK